MTRSTIGFVPTVDVDLAGPLDWPNLDGTVTVWPRPECHTSAQVQAFIDEGRWVRVEDTFPVDLP